MIMTRTNKNVVQSVERALSILSLFNHRHDELTFNEIAEKANLPKPTVARLLNTLEMHDFISKDIISGKYRLGVRLFYLGSIVQNSFNVRREALPEMLELNRISGETIDLNIIVNDRRVCIEKVETKHDVRNFIRVGESHHLFLTASSKVLLSSYDDEKIKRLAKEQNIDVDIQKVLEDVAKVRKNGYFVSEGERVMGGMSISAPIFNHMGKIAASISLVGPAFRVGKRKKEFIQLVKKAAMNISYKMGYKEAERDER